MSLHPEPKYQPIPVKVIIPESAATRSQRINPWIPADQPAATVCATDAGYQLKQAAIRPTQQIHRVLTGKERKRHWGLYRTDPEKPCPTILKDMGGSTTGIIHPYELRRLTIDEVKDVASYPKEFVLQGSFRERWAQIGNSVPPLFMKAIAANIIASIIQPARSQG